MDFSRFEESIKAEQAKFNEIKDVKDAAKYDEICNGLNRTLADIALVASYVPKESKKSLISILRTMRDFAMELVGYKRSFNYVVEEDPVVDEVVPQEPVQEKPIEPPTESISTSMETVEPVKEDPIEIKVDDGPSEQSQSESQSMSLNNAKVLTLNNPNVPKHSNPFVQPNAA